MIRPVKDVLLVFESLADLSLILIVEFSQVVSVVVPVTEILLVFVSFTELSLILLAEKIILH